MQINRSKKNSPGLLKEPGYLVLFWWKRVLVVEGMVALSSRRRSLNGHSRNLSPMLAEWFQQ